MKLFRPILSLVITLFVFQVPVACPPIYVKLAAYVQFEGEHVTKSELKLLNFNEIRDTAKVPITDKIINRFSVHVKKVGGEQFVHYHSGYAEDASIHEMFRKMMDTILPKYNLLDTVSVNFYLSNDEKSEEYDNEFYYYQFKRYRIQQQFIISSQAVVDLKRSGPEAGMLAYPSPATNKVSVRFNVKEPIAAHLTLTNSLGQVIEEQEQPNIMNVSSFDLKNQTSGTYFIRAKIDGEYFTRKIIKE